MGAAMLVDKISEKFDLSLRVFELVAQLSSAEVATPPFSVPLYTDIQKQIAARQKLSFILPAFPAKSSNREKTISAAPDYADVLGLVALNDVCKQINRIYSPGAEVVICSDGRVFNDIVMVSDADLMTYKKGIERIIAAKNLQHLRTFSLDDCYRHQDFAKMRKDLEENFSEAVDVIRQRVLNDVNVRELFNGIHRFMKEDMQALRPELSKNQVMRASKVATYQVMQRSGAWDRLLNQYFPTGLRLSIHPYPPSHKKFGVNLVGGADRWATPWHNVAVQVKGRFYLMKRKFALELGATLNFAEGAYAFYQVS